MIKNSILIYYNNDEKLGDYFYQCGIQSEYLLNQYSKVKQTQITGQNCNSVYINDIELPKHNEPSLLVIFSHGSTTSFSKHSELAFFGDFTEKPLCLDNGLVYSNACSVGLEFGEKLASDNASFFGYGDAISVDLNYQRVFIECDIYALHHILEGKTLSEAQEKAKQKFNERMRDVSFLAASYLMQARDRIVVHGNTDSPFF
jgi:hypothetical protein